MESFLIKTAQLLLAFSILVIIHEFGHYIFARMFGVKVEKFYMFFNPWFSLVKWKPKKKPSADSQKASWRDTEYGIGWIPLGGYVKIAGMIDESMDREQMAQPAKPWEFRSKPAYQRLLIMTAGVIFNFIIAIVIYTGIAFYWGESYVPLNEAKYGMQFSEAAHSIGFVDGDIVLTADGKPMEHPNDDMIKLLQAEEVKVLRNNTDTAVISVPGGIMKAIIKYNPDNQQPLMDYIMPVVVEQTTKGSGAYEAGLIHGDHIVGAAGEKTPGFTSFTNVLLANKGKTIPIDIIRNGKTEQKMVEVSENGKLGIMLQPLDSIYPIKYVKYSILQSIPRGAKLGVDRLTSYVKSMKLIFTKEGAQSIGGFGALGSIFPDKWNWLAFWNITAFLSIILAFMNILPIPALDGGHVLFLLFEVITRKQPGEKFLEYAQMIGMTFLILLLLYANANDIYRFLLK